MQQRGGHRGGVRVGIHADRRRVDQQVERPFQPVQRGQCAGGAGLERKHILAQRLACGEIRLPHGVDDFAAGQRRLAGEGAAHAPAAEQRDPPGERDAAPLQCVQKTVGIGVVAQAAFRRDGDGVDRAVQLRPPVKPVEQRDDRLLVGDGDVDPFGVLQQPGQLVGERLGRDILRPIGGRPAG